MEEMYALTLRKKTALKQKGYTYVSIWEHEFREAMQNDPQVKTFLQLLDIETRLDPRDSFFGGRTNASRLHYRVNEGEEIRYVDFTR